MDRLKDCAHECGEGGHSCRLKTDAIIYGLNIEILEGRGQLCLEGFAHADLGRVRDKRWFMMKMDVECTDEINCIKRTEVEELSCDNKQRIRALIEQLDAEAKELNKCRT
jgi:hypothetical protein